MNDPLLVSRTVALLIATVPAIRFGLDGLRMNVFVTSPLLARVIPFVPRICADSVTVIGVVLAAAVKTASDVIVSIAPGPARVALPVIRCAPLRLKID